MKRKLSILLILFSNLIFSQNEEILGDIDLLNFNKDFTSYNQLTAVYCSQVSEIVYWNSKEIEEFSKLVNNTYPDTHHHSELIDSVNKTDHTQALLWGNNQFLIISFRGTEPSKLKDWVSDAKFWKYENKPASNEELANMPAGHGGFRKSLMNLISKENIFDKIDEIILKCAPNADKSKFPIYLTGHSLGAAIAQLFIEPLNYKGYNFSGAYHFAPPLSVSCQAKDYMNSKYGSLVYDIVNYKDYVPRAGRKGVAHFGKFYRICENGLIYSEKESYTKFKLSEYLEEFELHSLKSHIMALKNHQNSFEEIKKRSVGIYPCVQPKHETNNCK